MSHVPANAGAKRKAPEDLEDSSGKKTKMATVAEENSENDTEDDDEAGDENDDDLSHLSDERSEPDFEEDYDEEPEQYEVEEHQHTLPSSRVVDMKLYISKDELGRDWSNWTYDIIVECKHEGEIIDMEKVAHEMSELAFEVFDRYGCLKNEFKEHPNSSQERVATTGFGNCHGESFAKKAEGQKQGLRFVISLPGNLNTRDLDDELKGKTKRERLSITDREYDAAVSFIRALGFRRIGGAKWFCLPLDPDHKARLITAVDDYDPPDRERDESDYETEDEEIRSSFYRQELLEEKRNKRMETKPLIRAAMALPDVECAEFLKSMKIDGQDWKIVDKSGNNVLHHAATHFKVTSIRWLLETIDPDTSLRLARNIDGYTPQEALQEKLETTRVSVEVGMLTVSKSDTFQGYHLDAVQCLASLHDLQNPTTDQLLRLKFGCTCGQCLQGLMSPRMKYALLTQAETTHDILDMEISDGPTWCEWHNYIITYVAPDIQTNFKTNKSYRQGFSNLFGYVAECLRSDIIPTTQNVLGKWENEGEWPPVAQNFLQRGGKVESVLQVVFGHAKDQDEKAGDGTFMYDFKEELLKLPSCRNDHEFGFVALACGFEGNFCDYSDYEPMSREGCSLM